MSLTPVTVRADVAAIDERAAAAGVTRSEYLRRLIEDDTVGGVWVAYYPDLSGVCVYASELDALRAATSAAMVVKFVKYGEGI